MRILVLTTSFPSSSYPVSGIFILNLLDKLPATYHITVLTPGTDRKICDQTSIGSIECKYFKYAPVQWQLLAHRPGGIPVAVSLQGLTWMLIPMLGLAMLRSAIVHSRQADLIHAHWVFSGIVAGLVGKIAGIPTIATLRGSDVRWAEKYTFFKKIIQFCVKLNVATVTVSRVMGDRIKSWCPQYQDKIAVISNGIDPAFGAIERRMEHRYNLTVIGNLIKPKRVDLVVDALNLISKKYDKLHLTIVGDGPELSFLQSRVNRMGLARRVAFTGAISPSEIPNQLAKSGILVLASVSEGRPNVVLEAMAAGVPVIASDIKAVRELIVHGERGLLFPVGDAECLAGCIKKILDDPLLHQRLTLSAKRWIENNRLTWSQTANNYAELYQQTVKEYHLNGRSR